MKPGPLDDVRLVLASRARRLADGAAAAERIRVLALLLAARDLDAAGYELERAVAQGEDSGAFRLRLEGSREASRRPAATDPARVLAWTRKGLLSCLRARDEATLRAAVRQVLRALLALARPGRRTPG